jgi:hypothetical protein
MKSLNTPNGTSSLESGDGRSPSEWQDGQTLNLSELDHAPASHSATLESNSAKKTRVTSGQCSATSSRSESLQLRLASKLRAALAANGSNIYALTWKDWATKSGPPICALRASVRRTSGNDSIGWQTPRARGDAGGSRWKDGDARNLEDQARIFALSRGLTIEEVARLSVSPMFCRRLMGYPVEWDYCGATAMQSSRNSRLSS